MSETSNIGSVTRNWGGVGRNVAECVARLSSTSRANTNSTNDSSNDHVKNSNGCQSSSHPTVMISAVGRDQQAQNIHQHLRSLHIDPLLIEPSSSSTEVYRTGSYMAMMNENGDLVSAIADTSVCKLIQPQSVGVMSKRAIIAQAVFSL